MKMKKKPASKRKKFSAQPGQVDFTNIRWAPVINCVATYRNKILLVRRGSSLRFHPDAWSGISGFLDDQKSLKEKVIEEFHEELGMKKSDILSIKLGEVFDQDEPKYKKTWIVHPVLVRVKTDRVALDWEAQKYKWVTVSATKKTKLSPGFGTVLQKIKLLMQK